MAHSSYHLHFLRFCLFFLITLSVNAQQKIHSLNIKNNQDLKERFRYTAGNPPLISGHRGGIVPGYPENSIAALEHTLYYTPAFFEVDPRLTKDSVIVLMHDATLDRTTNGTGRVSDHTLAELKRLRLKDINGTLTDYTIPTLEEAIIWSKGKTVLNLDKKDVSLQMKADIIRGLKADDHVMLTVHSAKEAQFFHKANSKLMFSAFILTVEAVREYEEAGIPWSNIMAYIGPKVKAENKELVEMLHARGVRCMISAASTYDKLVSRDERYAAYKEILQSGASVLESDLPIDVAKAINKSVP